MLWDWLFIVTWNSCSNVFQDSLHGVCWMNNKDLNKCLLSTQAKKDLSEWAEAFSARTYYFTACLADVPTARMGKRAIFYLGLWAKCKLWVVVWHPLSLGNPHQLSVADVSACKPLVLKLCGYLGRERAGIYITLAVVLQDLLSTCAVCLASHLFWSESYSWHSCS